MEKITPSYDDIHLIIKEISVKVSRFNPDVIIAKWRWINSSKNNENIYKKTYIYSRI